MIELRVYGLFGVFGYASTSQDKSDAPVPVYTEDNEDDDDEEEHTEDDEDIKVNEDDENVGDDGRFWRY